MVFVMRLCLIVHIFLFLSQNGVCSSTKSPLIGESEKVYALASGNKDIRGLAFDDVTPKAPRLFVLDSSGKIFVYRSIQNYEKGIDELKLVNTHVLPSDAGNTNLTDLRGLSVILDEGQEIVYFLNWKRTSSGIKSELWECNFKSGDLSKIDLTQYMYCIGNREVTGLAVDDDNLYLCFDASGYKDNNLRVQRGIIQYKLNRNDPTRLEFVKHLPDSGEYVSQGLAFMNFEGANYLWATAGNDNIYSAQAESGRGLFYFDRPSTTISNRKCWGLTFGDDALWVPEPIPGADQVHRVNVTRNLELNLEGPRILRHLTMTIQSEPEKNNTKNPGKVYHYYSRPYAYEQLHNQGVWPDAEIVENISDSDNVQIKKFTHDPGDDKFSRQYMSLVEYDDSTAKPFSSKYEIDFWTNPYRKYVYPHRVNKTNGKLKGTNYLADDTDLYNLSSTEVYDGFFERIREHIENKYGIAADMDNPYWAVRNTLEYIQDHYYYPGPEQKIPATVDYDRKHYDANPGDLKIALSENQYDKIQIIACSGTSVMLAGAMRLYGISCPMAGYRYSKRFFTLG